MENKLTTPEQVVSYIQTNVLTADELNPDDAAKYLTKLSAVYGLLLDDIRITEAAYLSVQKLAYETESKANRAKIVAMNDPAYGKWQKARNLEKLAIELSRSLKFYLRVKNQEYQN